MTQANLTLVIDGRRNETAALESIAQLQSRLQQQLQQQLQHSGQLCDRLILLLNQSTQTEQSPVSFNFISSEISSEFLEIIQIDPANCSALKPIFASAITQFIGYVPTGAIPAPVLPQIPDHSCFLPWIHPTPFPAETACESEVTLSAWIISTDLLKQIDSQLQQDYDYSLVNLIRCLSSTAIDFCWATASDSSKAAGNLTETKGFPNLRVLAIVPHYGCEAWLTQCLQSLLNQTRSPDNIVVVDDGSAVIPTEIVRQFPSVTLLAAPDRFGPYRLIQQVIQDTHYDAYLFQDADDWSSCDRLEKLLDTMVATDSDLVGTQELRVLESAIVPVCYPLNVNDALAEKPGHGLLHPSSLVKRDLIMRLGGFATGLQYGGDTEFLLRTIFVGRSINIPDFAYFRRKRSGSLTTAPETGLDSPARQRLIQQCKAKAYDNYAAKQAGQPLCLTPLLQGKPVSLRHICGPQLIRMEGQVAR